MPRARAKRIVSLGIGLIAAACLWHYLAPAALGGTTSYVVTDGVSMEPRFHAGDLALVRSQSGYRVGEIVAYHSRQLGTVVLHRIIRRDGSRYVFKGDNNNFVDFERPTAAQLVGALWLHVPGLGSRLQSLHSPLVIGGLVCLGTVLFAGVTLTTRRLRRRRQRRALQGRSRPRPARPAGGVDPLAGVVAVATVVAAPFVALAVIAFARPATAPGPVQASYSQTAELTYSASAAPGAAYPTGEVRTGDPLFTRVIDRVALRMESKLQARAAHSFAGTASMRALLQSTNGWHATLPLEGARSFHGDRAVVDSLLDLRSLLSLVAKVQSTTQVPGSYTLSIVGDVHGHGDVAGLPLRSAFSPQFHFSLGTLEVQPATKGTAGASEGLVQSSAGVARGRGERAAKLSLAALTVPVADARRIALGGIALVACLVVVALLLAGMRSEDEAARIRRRYGRLIVEVSRIDPAAEVATIDVGEIDALVRIAEHYDRSILHERESGAFWVIDESGWYRYAVGGEASWEPVGRVDIETLGFDVEGEVSAFAVTREHRLGQRSGWPAADDSTFV